jgi:hypothetical protein
MMEAWLLPYLLKNIFFLLPVDGCRFYVFLFFMEAGKRRVFFSSQTFSVRAVWAPK